MSRKDLTVDLGMLMYLTKVSICRIIKKMMWEFNGLRDDKIQFRHIKTKFEEFS